ncbi:beta-propeller domain-containing protein [Candidatus Pacearchaeota archaeon]|nr:beta-propeller domain-containing protein [Candidatus Pacearchaeota archaeon]
MKNKLFAIFVLLMFVATIFSGCENILPGINNEYQYKFQELKRFESDTAFEKVFNESRNYEYGGIYRGDVPLTQNAGDAASAKSESADSASGNVYSTTNVQVSGVDEADIVKTDGQYIYAISHNILHIAEAYPAEDAEIISTIEDNNFYINEMFINGDNLVLFGQSNYNGPLLSTGAEGVKAERTQTGVNGDASSEVKISADYYYPQQWYMSATSVKVYDISDKEKPEFLKSFDFEGNYLTSRMIDEDVYFVVNSYPRYYGPVAKCSDMIPMYRESIVEKENLTKEDFVPSKKCIDIGYIDPVQARSILTLASISLDDLEAKKELIVGSGENVFASQDNLYIVQTMYPNYYWRQYESVEDVGMPVNDTQIKEDMTQKTAITKFHLEDGNIKYVGTGKVNGRVLNQYSMDEYELNFRIATTIDGQWLGNGQTQRPTNNVYVLDPEMNLVGKLEELAPGETIYSARFMGDRGYMVTFKNTDPLFVIDMSNPTNPNVLGKLKIPGYSDYLHPYDENHLIGIGKEAEEAKSETGEETDFAWYQGVKMAIFDVTDVSNPVEMYKVTIGDRGTDSPVLRDPKAFLFDKEKGLLVLPITVREHKTPAQNAWSYGEVTFQGAYVYNIDLANGFVLRGKVSHVEDDQIYIKSGYYFDYWNKEIRRSLYIRDVLYTISESEIMMNKLDDLSFVNQLYFKQEKPVGDIVVGNWQEIEETPAEVATSTTPTPKEISPVKNKSLEDKMADKVLA